MNGYYTNTYARGALAVDCVTSCGDGVAVYPEQCDSGWGCHNLTCNCTEGTPYDPLEMMCGAICGNAFVDSGEDCDGGDGCSDGCKCTGIYNAYSPKKPKCKSELAAILGGVLGGLGGLFVLCVVIAVSVILWIYMRRKIVGIRKEAEERRRRDAESDHKLTLEGLKLQVEPLPFNLEEYVLLTGDDGPFTVAPPTLTFGLGSQQCEIDEVYTDTFTITSTSKRTLSFKVAVEGSAKYKFEFNPAEGTIKKGEEIEVQVDVLLRCTAIVKQNIVVIMEDTKGKVKVHRMVLTEIEGKLSTRLDSDEIELIQPPIGQGATGIVYQGKYRGMDVAVKHLRLQYIQEEDHVLRDFLREIEIMERLRAPQITNFVGAVIFPQKLCIVTEYAKLGSLGKVLKTMEMSYAVKFRMMLDCCKGMNFLHASGIVHRDLKPDNLLVFSFSLRADVMCKLTDFGTSRDTSRFDESAQLTVGLGTPIYMAPELLRSNDKDENSPPYTPAADVYSFGVMLYQLAINEEPYRTPQFKKPWDVGDFVCSGKRLPIPEDCEPDFKSLIEECWAQDANDRPTFAKLIPKFEAMCDKTKAEKMAKKAKPDDSSTRMYSTPQMKGVALMDNPEADKKFQTVDHI
eukprot:TRINITY_DN730_c0_g1_i5.p1 TRINITY_DN730_c0_g1~~TRINITY_DN730_c0_g1_i5.p1  ORF type:complete len:626 (-),score=124.31 TRINITY_DN730_c0_g1_i5:86-1963(-)